MRCFQLHIVVSVWFLWHCFVTPTVVVSEVQKKIPALYWNVPGLKTGGTALFRYWGFKVYESRLYLSGVATTDNVLLIRPKVLTLTYFRDFTADDFRVSSTEILKDNPAIDFSRAVGCLDQLSKLFQDVKSGDSYQLVHRESGELSLFLNDQLLGTVCDEYGTRAYFSIWLSREHSIKDSFQQELLGSRAKKTFFIAPEVP